MEQDIIRCITDLFAGADERDWDKVARVLADTVVLDYTSMNGGSPATLTPKQIVAAWSGFLPGFDRTHHQLSGFKIAMAKDTATATYHGKADHFLGAKQWVVEGNYDTALVRSGDHWSITRHTLHLIGRSGDLELPAEAARRMQQG